jgi:Kef-type K+ transport system membrane component KefB
MNVSGCKLLITDRNTEWIEILLFYALLVNCKALYASYGSLVGILSEEISMKTAHSPQLDVAFAFISFTCQL